MKKRILSFLLLTCLVISLLPLGAMADTTTAKVMILGKEELAVTEGGAPAYLKNKEFDAANKADGSTTFKAWGQEPGTAEDWNVKFEWPTGGVPTVTLKDAKFDYYDNETQTYAYIEKDGVLVSTDNRTTQDIEGSTHLGTDKNPIVAAIMPVKGCNIDLKVVLEGNIFVETGSGFVFGNLAAKENSEEALTGYWDDCYFKNLTFEGKEGHQVVANGGGIGIFAKTGYSLTFENANIDISTTVMGSNACPIHTSNGSITINGGHIKVKNMNNPAIWSSGVNGNITINGDITVENKLTSTAEKGGIYARDASVIVNGGNIVGTGHNCPVMSAGVSTVINGGNLKLTSGYYALYSGALSAVYINGGTTEITAMAAMDCRAFLGENIVGVAGPNPQDAEIYDHSTNHYRKPYLLLTDDATKLPDITPTEPSTPVVLPTTAPTQKPTTAPTQKPTQAPTQKPTQAPTQKPTAAPTQDATQAPTTAPTQDSTQAPTTAPTQASAGTNATQSANNTVTDTGASSDNSGNSTILIVAIAVVIVAGAAIAVIFSKRKKG